MIEELKLHNIILSNNKINPSYNKIITPTIIEQIVGVTSFLPITASITERLYCILNNIDILPLCLTCNNKVIFVDSSVGYRKFCSKKCAARHPSVNQKRKTQIKETNIKKYGTEHYFQTEDFKSKKEISLHEHYGTTNIMQNLDILEKRSQTNVEKYGTLSPLQHEETKKKTQKTNLEKYGTVHASSSDMVKQKVKQTFRRKYSCEQNQLHISPESLKCLSDEQTLYTLHHVEEKSLTEIASMLNVDVNTVCSYFKTFRIEIKRFQHSSLEHKLLTDLQALNLRVESNNRQIIAPQELDIIIPEYKLAIEICGLYWHNELNVDSYYHLIKLKRTNAAGYSLLTIFEDEIKYKYDIVLNTIKHKCGLNNVRIFARNTQVVDIHDKQVKERFFTKYHIQGNGPGSVTYGLYYDNNIVAMMTFIVSKNNAILNRYATSSNVVGGFSKLLTHAEKHLTVTHIETFADLRWSSGDLYEKNGFVLDNILSPDYMYVIGDKTFHKFNFRHKFLPTKLKKYDATLSEHQNCLNNRIYRIYNCGLKKYRKTVDLTI